MFHTGELKMDNIKAIVFTLLLLVMSPTAFALVWQDPYWLPVGTSDPNTVNFGATATAASGAFSSIDTSVHFKAELRKGDGTIVKVLSDKTVDISTYTGFERVDIASSDYAQAGSYFVKFTISDSHESRNKQLRLSVAGQNSCPVLTQIGSMSGREGELLTFTVAATDADNNALTYSASGLPQGASFDANTRTFSWTPGYSQAGTYSVTLTVTDGTCVDSEIVTITVSENSVPTITFNAVPTTGPEGTMVSFACTATGGDAPVSYMLDFGDGNSIAVSNARHQYSFDGNYDAVCTVTDRDGNTDSANIAITITNVVPTVDLVATPSSGNSPLDVAFDCRVNSGNHPFTYVFDFGDGTNVVQSTSTVTHKYTAEMTYSASCTVTDADGDMATDLVAIIVSTAPINNCPVLNNVGDRTVRVGDALSFTVSATDADGDALSYSADAPYTIFIDPSTGLFSWTPAAVQVGTHAATFRVTDGTCEDSETISIVVQPVTSGNVAPVADFTWSPLNPEAGQNVRFTSTSTDANGDALTCAWDFDADGQFEAGTCTADWAFGAPGANPVTLIVSDGELSNSETKTVNVVGHMNVAEISCFSPVIEGSLESCSVKVESDAGTPVGGANVRIYYLDGTAITNCVTNDITGSCRATFSTGNVGHYIVYATAEKAGWVSDLDKTPTEEFDVFARRYVISDLKVFNNAGFSVEDYDFFRGEYLYVHFVVSDLQGNPADDLITSVALVSPPGGMALFDAFNYQPRSAGNYYYDLRIPTTHDFIGGSQVFTFAFNFSDGSGAQMVVNVIIRNNLPVIADSALLGRFNTSFNAATSVDLNGYATDLEDSADKLVWTVTGVNPSVAEVTMGINNTLSITPIAQGTDVITLMVSDIDGGVDTLDVPIMTGNAPVLPQCSDGIDNDADGLVDFADPDCQDAADNDEGAEIAPPAPVIDVFHDIDDLVVKRISVNGVDAENAAVVPGSDIRIVVSMMNNLEQDLEDVKVEASVYDLTLRSTGFIRELDMGDSKSVAFNFAVPFDALPGIYDVRFVFSNDDVRRVKYGTIEIV